MLSGAPDGAIPTEQASNLPMAVTVVVPALQEERTIERALRRALDGLQDGDEVFVVDGGSTDRTVELAQALGARVLHGARGRGRQMNTGAAAARGDVLLFLHADTVLPTGFRRDLVAALAGDAAGAGAAVAPRGWGRYDLRFDEGGVLLHLIAWLISRRSRLFRSATGDQALFVRRALFEAVGGYREELLFEDVDLARRLRRLSPMAIPRGAVVTSARRWRNRGVWATTLRMWTLKTLYLCGVSSEFLSRHYRDER